MDRLIPIVNKLQDVVSTLGLGHDTIDLPQIVVVGSQSSGKSSVLENIVGRDFLPRGSGIVTRRPLILQLVARPRTDGDIAPEWGEFLHKPGEKFPDFHAICREIVAETERVTGSNKGISPVPINLRIYSPNVVDLTLVDLPGITKVPVGDQPTDIEKQIRQMILTYIERPNAIILAVTAANTDLANSDALKLARHVDASGNRTLGVLTKLDLMDRGTHAADILNNEVIKLKLGFIGVVNRSQLDIDEAKPISSALEAERAFFNSHPIYRPMAARLGTQYLAKTLNKLLIVHIKACLPALKKRVSTMSTKAVAELAGLGEPPAPDRVGGVVLEIITKFANDFKSSIDGTQQTISATELSGGARISYIFHNLFYDAVDKINPLEGLTEEDIRTVIRNATGTKHSMFTPEASFEILVRKAISKLKEPSMLCVNLVYDELERLLASYGGNKDLSRFQQLNEQLHSSVSSTFQKCLKPTYSMVSNLINVEMAYINTRHPEFVKKIPSEDEILQMASQMGIDGSHPAKKEGPGFLARLLGPRAPHPDDRVVVPEPPAVLKADKPMDDRERLETELVRILLVSYYDIVKKNIQDGVPKAVMLFLVNNSTSHVQNELVKTLYKDSLMAELTEESEDTIARRATLQTQVKVLKKADEILSEIRDFNERGRLGLPGED